MLDQNRELLLIVVWKKNLRSTSNKYWTSGLQETGVTKSSQRFINTTILEIENVHPVWEYASQNLSDVRQNLANIRSM